jgi:hypothetical protein
MSSLPAFSTWLRRDLPRMGRRARTAVCSRVYVDRDRNLAGSAMIAGTARSGTTWLAEVLASRFAGRIMFEPFHAPRMKALRDLHYFHYLRPTDANRALTTFARTVFSGEIRDPWVDRSVDRLLPRWRVVKEIRASLFLRWLHLQFPEVPMLLILRHPCAVVLSRMELGWATDRDIEPFLMQPALVEDHLETLIDVIRGARTAEEKHAIIWCVTTLVPLRQFTNGDLPVVFYEDLCERPDATVAAVCEAVGKPHRPAGSDVVGRPSTTAKRLSAVHRGENLVERWQRALTKEQVGRILDVVDAFGLSHLYGGGVAPRLAWDVELGLPRVAHLRRA